MVKIKRYAEQVVAAQALPSVSINPGAFRAQRSGGAGGGGLASAFGGHADQQANAERERQKAFHSAALDAVDSQNEYGDHLLNGEEIELPGMAGPGLLQRQGEDYLSASGVAEDAYSERAEITMGRLPAEARTMAERQFRLNAQAFGQTILLRETKEREGLYRGRYERGQDQLVRSTVGMASEGVTLGASGLQSLMIDHKLLDMEGRIRVHASEYPELRDGLTEDEWVAAELRDRRTALHEGMIDALSAKGRDQEASAYFERYGDDIEPEVATRIEAQVTAARITGDSLRLTAMLQKTMPVDVGATAALGPAAVLSERLKVVDEQATEHGWDEVQREDARATVRDETVRERREAEALHLERFTAVDEALIATKGDWRTVRRTFWKDVQDAHPSEIEAWEARARFYADGRDLNAQATRVALLRTMSYRDPEGFKQRNLVHDMAVLGDKEFEAFAIDQKKMMDGEQAIGTVNARAIDTVLDVLYPGVKDDDDGYGARVLDGMELEAEITRQQKLEDRQFSEAEVKQRLRTLLVPRLKERGWFYDTYELSGELKEVPRGEQLRIEADLRNAGLGVSNRAVLAIYNLEQARSQGGRAAPVLASPPRGHSGPPPRSVPVPLSPPGAAATLPAARRAGSAAAVPVPLSPPGPAATLSAGQRADRVAAVLAIYNAAQPAPTAPAVLPVDDGDDRN